MSKGVSWLLLQPANPAAAHLRPERDRGSPSALVLALLPATTEEGADDARGKKKMSSKNQKMRRRTITSETTKEMALGAAAR